MPLNIVRPCLQTVIRRWTTIGAVAHLLQGVIPMVRVSTKLKGDGML